MPTILVFPLLRIRKDLRPASLPAVSWDPFATFSPDVVKMRNAVFRLGLLFILAQFMAAGASAQWLEEFGIGESPLASWSHGPPAINPDLAPALGIGHQPCYQCGYPGWFARGEAIFLTRTRTQDNLLTVAVNATPTDLSDDIPLISARDFRFSEFETGYRLEMGRWLLPGLMLEGSYFRLREWDAEAQVTSTGQFITVPGGAGDALSPPFPQPFPGDLDVNNFFQSLQHTFTYQSELINAEMNLRAVWNWRHMIRSELVGFRYLQLRERFTMVSIDDRLATPQQGIGTYTIRADNDLYGLQYGQELVVPVNNCLRLTGNVKAGLYVNDAIQRSRIINDNIVVVDTEGDKADLALVGEVNFRADYQINKFLAVRGGYQMMWLDGLALAPEQYTFFPLNFDDLDRSGNLFIHGFTIGIELKR
jgi:hypothetical protein